MTASSRRRRKARIDSIAEESARARSIRKGAKKASEEGVIVARVGFEPSRLPSYPPSSKLGGELQTRAL